MIAVRDCAIRKMRSERGLSVEVAEACGITRSAVYQWERVPLHRVAVVARMLRMKPEQVRPDYVKERRQ